MNSTKENFFERVYEVVRYIPEGRVTSYGMIASYLGSSKSARTVGYAMNACLSYDPDLPAHRVVNRNGALTGKHHFAQPDLMENLLKNEGFDIIDDQILDVKNYWWDPKIELS